VHYRAWNGNSFFFYPDTTVNDVNDFNAAFAQDDVIAEEVGLLVNLF